MAELKRAAVSAEWELTPGTTDEAVALAQVHEELVLERAGDAVDVRARRELLDPCVQGVAPGRPRRENHQRLRNSPHTDQDE